MFDLIVHELLKGNSSLLKLERILNKPMLVMGRATHATCDIQKFQTLEEQILSLYGNTAFLSGRRNGLPVLKKPRCPKGLCGLLATEM